MSLYEYKAKVERVVDGDTLDVQVDLGFFITHKVRVRMLGYNARELHSGNFETTLLAKKDMEAFMALLPVGLECLIRTHKTDKYGRYLAQVVVGDKDINQAMSDYLAKEQG
jgi:endonuclease YncB( thermonuclease family)